MAEEEKRVRVQVMLTPEMLEKIDELARLLGGTRSGLAAKLIEEAMYDNEWVIRHLAAPFKKMMERWGKRPKGQSE